MNFYGIPKQKHKLEMHVLRGNIVYFCDSEKLKTTQQT